MTLEKRIAQLERAMSPEPRPISILAQILILEGETDLKKLNLSPGLRSVIESAEAQ